MKTLTIDFFLRDPSLKLKGLSLKALDRSNIWQSIYRDQDDGEYRIDSRHRIDGRTAKIEKDFLIKILAELRTLVPFDKIKFKGCYPTSPDEILAAIKKATE